MSTETTSAFRRHDALTLRIPRTLEETQDSRYSWWSRYDSANDDLPQRRRGAGHHVIDFVGDEPMASFWIRNRRAIISTTRWRTARLAGLSVVLALAIGLWWSVR